MIARRAKAEQSGVSASYDGSTKPHHLTLCHIFSLNDIGECECMHKCRCMRSRDHYTHTHTGTGAANHAQQGGCCALFKRLTGNMYKLLKDRLSLSSGGYR